MKPLLNFLQCSLESETSVPNKTRLKPSFPNFSSSLLLLLFPMFLFSSNENNQTQESFLSTVEYGKMLYINPRGISCVKCHGKKGKGGQKIAKYYDKDKNPKILKGVNIQEYTLEELEASLKNEYRENNRRKQHKIMPMYYLTDGEVNAIYAYLQSK